MTPQEKALKLIKITFERMAKATNYKGVEKDGGKHFGILEDISKKIAIDFISEINKENLINTPYWEYVKSEIVKM